MSNIKYSKNKTYNFGSLIIWLLVIVWGLVIGNWNFAFAQEVTLFYTGETHAMLYTCSCPIERDGGISRRAGLVKELRKKYPNALLLDSGGFFAGGLMDEYTQNIDLDMKRTGINLKAMELMKFDAANIGDSEFNFGRKFLEEKASATKIPFLSCNIDSGKFKPFIIKEVDGLKIGIVGATGIFSQQKAEGLKITDSLASVKGAVVELMKKNVNIVVLLSQEGESEDLELVKKVPGIDIVIVGHFRVGQDSVNKVGTTIFLRPSWQGRKLGRITLAIKDNKIIDYKQEDIRLSDKIKDDPEILAILPRCFSDVNCRKEGFIGTCQNPGAQEADCSFRPATKINLTVISLKECRVCNTNAMVDSLKKQFPGLVVSYLYYPDKAADKLVKELGINTLPAYLFSKELDQDKAFEGLKNTLEAKAKFYIIKPQVSGVSFFLNRKNIKGKMDLFLSLYEKDSDKLLELIKTYNPKVHFLALVEDKGFTAARGTQEVEEYLRCACVQKYYPAYFWDYISCRAKNINSSWWEDCLKEPYAQKIKACARSEEGNALLRENIALNKEIEVLFGPTYLLDNQEVFATQGAPTEEGLKKILKK